MEEQEDFKWEDFETPSSYNKKMESIEKTDPFADVRIHPSIKKDTAFYEKFAKAKENSYTTEEIIDYLNKEAKKPWIEKKISDRLESFNKDHPMIFPSLVCVILFALFFILIKYVWKLAKFIIYQISYTIAKAIKDASNP